MDTAALSADEILAETAHRPWPLPSMPWVMFQQWSDLLFAHWAVDPQIVRRLVPEVLELDLFEGKAWVAQTPFRMTDLHMRGLPAIPGAGKFLEMNLRTYVRAAGAAKPGVYFFRLDASNLPAVVGARVGLGLPYFWSTMTAEEEGGEIHYTSRRRDGDETVEADMRYAGEGGLIVSKSPLERFLTERYCLYEVHLGALMRTEIHHLEWPLQKARAVFLKNSVARPHGLPISEGVLPTLLHFSKRIEVLIYPPSLVG